MIVVSDASPIMSLAAVGRLDLLHKLYGEVVIPRAVKRELEAAPSAPGSNLARTVPWIRVRNVEASAITEFVLQGLDPGEAEAVALALEMEAELLLIDEHRGRAVATRLGCRVIGVLGILIEAKRRGVVPRVTPILEALVSEAGFYTGEELFRRVVEAAGE